MIISNPCYTAPVRRDFPFSIVQHCSQVVTCFFYKTENISLKVEHLFYTSAVICNTPHLKRKISVNYSLFMTRNWGATVTKFTHKTFSKCMHFQRCVLTGFHLIHVRIQLVFFIITGKSIYATKEISVQYHWMILVDVCILV